MNREIIRRNMMLGQAKEMFELAKQEVQSIQHSKIKDALDKQVVKDSSFAHVDSFDFK